jgi:hypothetical protein
MSEANQKPDESKPQSPDWRTSNPDQPRQPGPSQQQGGQKQGPPRSPVPSGNPSDPDRG